MVFSLLAQMDRAALRISRIVTNIHYSFGRMSPLGLSVNCV